MIMRLGVLLSSLLMVPVYFFPLWKIGLKAPQYPEGLGIQIWINKVAGDIRNLNILNHYIGMNKIEPEKIPELAYFPYIFGFLIVTGILLTVINRVRLQKLWCGAVLVFAVLGLYDFYLWEYNFGHDISPDAPMQLEESYQPPMIGTKEILNITATSWPGPGGWSFTAATALAGLLLALSMFGRGRQSSLKGISSLLLMSVLLVSCKSGSRTEAIEPGRDECGGCRMIISDMRYGGEVIMKKGKVFKFDSIDCLVEYYRANSGQIGEVYVIDFFHPGQLIEAERAVFGELESRTSPMGSRYTAYSSEGDARQVLPDPNSPLYGWDKLLQNMAR